MIEESLLIDLLKAGNYQLIDVREPMELEMDGEIEGALNIPLGQLEERKNEIMNTDDNLIFFCRSGGRAGKAEEFFKKLGLTNVYNGGGYKNIRKALDELASA